MFSSYLNGIRGKAKELVNELSKSFKYVSLLATDNTGVAYMADRRNSVVREGAGECGTTGSGTYIQIQAYRSV